MARVSEKNSGTLFNLTNKILHKNFFYYMKLKTITIITKSLKTRIWSLFEPI